MGVRRSWRLRRPPRFVVPHGPHVSFVALAFVFFVLFKARCCPTGVASDKAHSVDPGGSPR
jgi:hypothetical protein